MSPNRTNGETDCGRGPNPTSRSAEKRARVQTSPLPLLIGDLDVTAVVSTRERNSIAKKQLALRENLWPGAAPPNLWDRSAHKGFTTIPKTMPLILQIMDGMAKGQPVSSTYMALWCSQWDDSFVTLSKPQDMAYAAGFSGQRGVRTWASRMKLLHSLRFIDIKPRNGQALGYALIWNPHVVIKQHHAQKTSGLVASLYTALIELALNVGAKDMAGK